MCKSVQGCVSMFEDVQELVRACEGVQGHASPYEGM